MTNTVHRRDRPLLLPAGVQHTALLSGLFLNNYWESYFRMQEQGLVGPRQGKHYSKMMKQHYRSLRNEFTTSTLVNHYGVSQRNTEKIVKRLKKEGHIVMKKYGIYEKVLLDDKT